MRIGLKYITPVLAAGAAAVGIAVAPTAAAADQASCVSTNTSTLCQSPGNFSMNSSIPAPYAGPYSSYGPFFTGGGGGRGGGR
jgi:hypothetical protein